MNKFPDCSDAASNSAGAALPNLARIYAGSDQVKTLDTSQLEVLEQEFRRWAQASVRKKVLISRKRIFLIFMIIRYTAAQLSEVLNLKVPEDFNWTEGVIEFGKSRSGDGSACRQVQISGELVSELSKMIGQVAANTKQEKILKVDPGHVRRKFYERAGSCGFPKDMGTPSAIRKARAIELLRSNMPLPVVQRILGHSTPDLTASLMNFSENDIHQVARHFIDRESQRKTSARNTFFGKISAIRRGDIQSHLDLVTISGEPVVTVITNHSLERLGLKEGSLVTAEVKAPWVILQKAETRPMCTAENVFRGTVSRVLYGEVAAEFIVSTKNGLQLCSVISKQSAQELAIKKNEKVWVIFNCFAVVLHVD